MCMRELGMANLGGPFTATHTGGSLLPHFAQLHAQVRGFQAFTVPVRRRDWLRVARGLVSPAYWRAAGVPASLYGWYLALVQATLTLALRQTGAPQVRRTGANLPLLQRPLSSMSTPAACFSWSKSPSECRSPWSGTPPAAGLPEPSWLTRSTLDRPPRILSSHMLGCASCRAAARPLLACVPLLDASAQVAAIVTLGAPHSPPTQGSGRDVTGGALSYVHRQYPGEHRPSRLRRPRAHGHSHICPQAHTLLARACATCAAAAGQCAGISEPRRASLARYSYNSYKQVRPSAACALPEQQCARTGADRSCLQVCGQGQDIDGDAVVPNCSAFLPGADNLLLEGCMHSMAKVGSFTAPGDHVWWGPDRRIQPVGRQQSGVCPAQALLICRYGTPGALDVWLGQLTGQPVG